ncbi:glutamine synthetase [Trypanosoma cruzi]|nr:glutamine synthetase [Trypanosoma cruzi]
MRLPVTTASKPASTNCGVEDHVCVELVVRQRGQIKQKGSKPSRSMSPDRDTGIKITWTTRAATPSPKHLVKKPQDLRRGRRQRRQPQRGGNKTAGRHPHVDAHTTSEWAGSTDRTARKHTHQIRKTNSR